MIRIPVTTPSRSYEVLIGGGLLARAGECLSPVLGNRKAFVITTPPVKRCWSKPLLQSLKATRIQTTLLEMRDGERAKRLPTLEKLADQLVKQGADRGAVLIALGGGVVGDVTGFLASIYMRAIRCCWSRFFAVEIAVPSEYTSKAQRIISTRRGQLFGYTGKEGWKGWDAVAAYLPQAEMGDLIVELRSLTMGVGTFSWKFDHLQELNGREASKVVEERKAALAAQ